MDAGEHAVRTAPRGTFAALLACSFAASFGQSMMNIALPEVARRFDVTLSVANWLIVGYTVVAAVSVMLAAFLLRRLGLRRLFFVGMGALAIGSGLALFAPDFPTLLGCRLVQAVCTGVFFPTVTGVILTITPTGKQGVRLALNSGIIAVGLAVSPMVSGLVLTYAGFSWVFAVPCILALVLLAVGFRVVHDVRPPTRHAKADPLSALLGLAGLALLVFGLSEITRDAPPSLAALAAGVVLLGLFAWRQLRVDDPLLNLRPLGHPLVAVGLALVMLGMLVSFSLSVLLPLYLEGADGNTAFAAGLLLLGPVLVNAVSSFAGGRLFDRYGTWPLLPVGFVLVVAGQVWLYFAAEAFALLSVVLAAALSYVGLGLVVSPSKTAALRQLPANLYAHGAAINSTLVQIASAIGPSLFVGVLSADVVRETARGVAESEAYALGFSHTLTIAMGVAVASLVIGFVYARIMRTRASKN